MSGANVGAIAAFSAGFLSFMSPCVIPLIPAYITYLAGSAVETHKTQSRANLLLNAFGFIIGFSLVFITMGASASYLGQLIAAYKALYQKISGGLIVVFGLYLLGVFKFRILTRDVRWINRGIKNTGRFTPVIMGMAFAAGWTPCIGPILSAILLYASTSETIGFGVYLLTLYSLGLAIPFLITALAIKAFQVWFKKISPLLPIISRISGIVLIVFGVLIYLNKLSILNSYFF